MSGFRFPVITDLGTIIIVWSKTVATLSCRLTVIATCNKKQIFNKNYLNFIYESKIIRVRI